MRRFRPGRGGGYTLGPGFAASSGCWKYPGKRGGMVKKQLHKVAGCMFLYGSVRAHVSCTYTYSMYVVHFLCAYLFCQPRAFLVLSFLVCLLLRLARRYLNIGTFTCRRHIFDALVVSVVPSRAQFYILYFRRIPFVDYYHSIIGGLCIQVPPMSPKFPLVNMR